MTDIQFATWPPAYIAPIFTAGLAVYQTMRMDVVWRVPLVMLWFAVGFCWGQAAGIHIGPHATQWAIYSVVPFALAAAVGYFGFRTSQRNQFREIVKETIAGENVTLRPTSRDDLELLAGWSADPSFVTWWGGKPKTRVEVATKYLNEDPTRKAFVVLADGEPVGFMQAWSDEPPDGGIDIVLKPDAQGKGFGTDAARTLAKHLRANGWRKITVDPVSQNYRAIKSFEKAGFIKDRLKGAHILLAFGSGN